METFLPNVSCTDRFLPNLKRLLSQQAIIDRLHQVAAKAKEILSKAVECQELLSLRR